MIPSGLPIWAVFIAVAFTGGFITSVFNHLWDWIVDRDKRIIDVVEQAILHSKTIASINVKMSNDYEHMASIDEQLKQASEARLESRLEVLRLSLFMAPHDQYSHIHSINDGKKYLQLGGNGEGHAQYNRLVKNYERRLEVGDWDYTPGHVVGGTKD